MRLAAIREQSEQELEERKLAFEQQLAIERAALEEAQELRTQELEAQQQERRDAFERSQRIARLQFEDQQRQAERAFREEQRRLDEESANDIRDILDGPGLVEEIKAILESTNVPSTEQAEAVKEILESVNIPGATGDIPGFREGGVTPGGVVKVGEGGSELAALPRGTRVLTNRQSRQVATQAIQQNPEIASGLVRNESIGQNNGLNRAQPLLTQPSPVDNASLLRGQLQAMQQLNRTQARALREFNMVRREQANSGAALAQLADNRSRLNSDSAINLILGGIV